MAHDRRKADHIRINLEENVQFPSADQRVRALPAGAPGAARARPGGDRHLRRVARQDAAPPVSDLVDDRRDGSGAGHQPQPGRRRAGPRASRWGWARSAPASSSPRRPTPSRCATWRPTSCSSPTSARSSSTTVTALDQCRRAVEMIEADALILHLNPLQEAVQADGDWNWRGLLAQDRGGRARRSGVPVVAKEVGWGISEATAAAAGGGRGRRDRRGRLRRHVVDRGRVPPGDVRRVPQAGARVCRLGHPDRRVAADGAARRAGPAADRQRRACGRASRRQRRLALGATLVGVASSFLKAAAVGPGRGGRDDRSAGVPSCGSRCSARARAALRHCASPNG